MSAKNADTAAPSNSQPLWAGCLDRQQAERQRCADRVSSARSPGLLAYADRDGGKLVCYPFEALQGPRKPGERVRAVCAQKRMPMPACERNRDRGQRLTVKVDHARKQKIVLNSRLKASAAQTHGVHAEPVSAIFLSVQAARHLQRVAFQHG